MLQIIALAGVIYLADIIGRWEIDATKPAPSEMTDFQRAYKARKQSEEAAEN